MVRGAITEAAAGTKPAQRIRFRLLVLLWVWALLVFAIVDLFWNVQEFDGVRPRASLYHGMRAAAHQMVGEPLDASGLSRDSVLAATPSRAGEFASLRRAALRSDIDPVLRARVLGDFAGTFGPEAVSTLLAVVHNAEEPELLRAECARLLGHAGDLSALVCLIESDLPDRIKEAAVRGLAVLGTEQAADEAVARAADPLSRTSLMAVRTIEAFEQPEALRRLAAAARSTNTNTATRVSACRALCADSQNTETLAGIAADRTAPLPVRTAAIDSLARIGTPAASAALETAGKRPEIAGRVREARLRHTPRKDH